MRFLDLEKASTVTAFDAFATIRILHLAARPPTPTIDFPAKNRLTEDKPQALYDLR